mmetsp:Transcript_20091/g.66832  ORF Transcript_20091/g.66832 Transcript_20091/m.66832 type:complete len:98 (-) Transcript_20091:1785-2078(-)
MVGGTGMSLVDNIPINDGSDDYEFTCSDGEESISESSSDETEILGPPQKKRYLRKGNRIGNWTKRNMSRKRLDWYEFQRTLSDYQFRIFYRMSRTAF